MEFEVAKLQLKQQLLKEVAQFYKRDHRLWKEPVVETLRDLQKAKLQAVFFGGTLRSLLISRLLSAKPGRPRDVDIVVSGASIESLKERFSAIISRETRFGGLQLRRVNWQFDVWPLTQTWAFQRDSVNDPDFAALPTTTFFNLEAVAVEVWPQPGRTRQIFSGDDQFFEGILARTLEINREDNPFPDLCVVRALVMAADLDFHIGPKLARYITHHGLRLTSGEMDDIQQKHYGELRGDSKVFRNWIAFISDRHSRNAVAKIRLPLLRQGRLWSATSKTRCQ